MGSRLIVNREVNLNPLHYVALTLTAPVEPRQGWSIYNTAVVFYNHYAGELLGANRNLSRAHSLVLGKSWSAELNVHWQV